MSKPAPAPITLESVHDRLVAAHSRAIDARNALNDAMEEVKRCHMDLFKLRLEASEKTLTDLRKGATP